MLSGANQQERLSQTSRPWLITEPAKWFLGGFIEGEGTLVVSMKYHQASKFGVLVDPEFFLYQHQSGRPLLELAQQTLGTGKIFAQHGNPQVLVYGVVSRRSLVEKVVPFFERYVVPFSSKREAFEGFKEILQRMDHKEHQTPEGLCRIVRIAYTMNPNSKGKPRLRTLEEVCERILRGHTPDAPSVESIELT